jgi:TRAP-type C4-dicarboxylate transport system substrate-binding protein
MEHVMSFGEVLEVFDELSLEEQETLLDVMQRRVVERRREEIVQEIQAAQREFESGQCQVVTPDELLAEILA